MEKNFDLVPTLGRLDLPNGSSQFVVICDLKPPSHEVEIRITADGRTDMPALPGTQIGSDGKKLNPSGTETAIGRIRIDGKAYFPVNSGNWTMSISSDKGLFETKRFPLQEGKMDDYPPIKIPKEITPAMKPSSPPPPPAPPPVAPKPEEPIPLMGATGKPDPVPLTARTASANVHTSTVPKGNTPDASAEVDDTHIESEPFEPVRQPRSREPATLSPIDRSAAEAMNSRAGVDDSAEPEDETTANDRLPRKEDDTDVDQTKVHTHRIPGRGEQRKESLPELDVPTQLMAKKEKPTNWGKIFGVLLALIFLALIPYSFYMSKEREAAEEKARLAMVKENARKQPPAVVDSDLEGSTHLPTVEADDVDESYATDEDTWPEDDMEDDSEEPEGDEEDEEPANDAFKCRPLPGVIIAKTGHPLFGNQIAECDDGAYRAGTPEDLVQASMKDANEIPFAWQTIDLVEVDYIKRK